MGRPRKYKTDEERKHARREYVKRYRDTDKGKLQRYTSRRAYYERTAYAVNSKKIYSDAECIAILAKRFSDDELAKKMGRSVAGIQRKRWALLKMLEYTE